MCTGIKAQAMNNEDVIKLTKANMTSMVIISAINQAKDRSFDVSTESLLSLKSQGVKEEVIAAMLSPGQPASIQQENSLSAGGYFKHGGSLERATELGAPDVTASGKAYIPIVGHGHNVPFYAWFKGAKAGKVLDRGDEIILAGYDVKPDALRFTQKEGKRYVIVYKSGLVSDDCKVTNMSFSRDTLTGYWTATLPKDLPPGEYCVIVELAGQSSPVYDFAVRDK